MPLFRTMDTRMYLFRQETIEEQRDNELQIPEFLRTHQGSIRERGKMARRG